jgi:hypothetical protein
MGKKQKPATTMFSVISGRSVFIRFICEDYSVPNHSSLRTNFVNIKFRVPLGVGRSRQP